MTDYASNYIETLLIFLVLEGWNMLNQKVALHTFASFFSIIELLTASVSSRITSAQGLIRSRVTSDEADMSLITTFRCLLSNTIFDKNNNQ